jgi:hypothetical protein
MKKVYRLLNTNLSCFLWFLLTTIISCNHQKHFWPLYSYIGIMVLSAVVCLISYILAEDKGSLTKSMIRADIITAYRTVWYIPGVILILGTLAL